MIRFKISKLLRITSERHITKPVNLSSISLPFDRSYFVIYIVMQLWYLEEFINIKIRQPKYKGTNDNDHPTFQ